MELPILESLRWLHILSGSAALLAGPLAMLKQDGGRFHRRSGLVYFWSMLVIFITSMVLSLARENWFLFMVGLFSCYLVVTGYRALSLKMLHRGQKAERFDWVLLFLSSLATLGLFTSGAWFFLKEQNSFGIVPLVFGIVMGSGVRKDYRRFTVPPTEKNHWLIRHITSMMGGYIATVTAFLVQNVSTRPAFVAWLLPTLVITPLIVLTVRKIKKGKGKIALP
ncbi:MAG: hypothetical protein JNL88_03465 [Bacteroidia bacterium]|nr:hypothetical protein [Bacteroidia bacterium]